MPRTKSNNFYIGIDPGKSGGLVCIHESDRFVDYTPMPGSEAEIWDWFIPYTNRQRRVFGAIERVHSMPKQGVKSMFSFGTNYGSLRMALAASGTSWFDVTPQGWMKCLGISSRKDLEGNAWKDHLCSIARAMYPDLPIWKEKRALGKQRAVADALLIAEYCRRTRS